MNICNIFFCSLIKQPTIVTNSIIKGTSDKVIVLETNLTIPLGLKLKTKTIWSGTIAKNIIFNRIFRSKTPKLYLKNVDLLIFHTTLLFLISVIIVSVN
jgi:hypothetical protein